MSEAKPTFGDPIGPWHRWFAWFPIKTYDRRRVFLHYVERRCIQRHAYLSGGPDFWFQYRRIEP